MRTLLLAGLIACAPLAAGALEAPRPGLADPRIQFVDYDPDQVVLIRGAMGYQLMLEFAADERIENVSIGDSLGWQVTPNRRANLLFLKPIDGASTNMTVITNARRYVFQLSVAPKNAASAAPYTVRFIYPEAAVALPVEVPQPEARPIVANAAYAIAGSPESRPVRVFDDGRMTYFEWSPDGALPAIFAVGSDGAESVVNYSMRGAYIVVEQLAGRFALRNGAQVATVTNQAWAYPMLKEARK